MRTMVSSWLAGPAAAEQTPSRKKKGALDLPESGAGSAASAGSRAAAFAIDAVLAALVAGLFTAPELPKNWSLVALVAEYLIFTGFFGRTPGMRLLGIRLASVDSRRAAKPGATVSADSRLGLLRAFIRVILLVLLIPALIWNADGRGFHDRFAGVVVVRA